MSRVACESVRWSAAKERMYLRRRARLDLPNFLRGHGANAALLKRQRHADSVRHNATRWRVRHSLVVPVHARSADNIFGITLGETNNKTALAQ